MGEASDPSGESPGSGCGARAVSSLELRWRNRVALSNETKMQLTAPGDQLRGPLPPHWELFCALGEGRGAPWRDGRQPTDVSPGPRRHLSNVCIRVPYVFLHPLGHRSGYPRSCAPGSLPPNSPAADANVREMAVPAASRRARLSLALTRSGGTCTNVPRRHTLGWHSFWEL